MTIQELQQEKRLLEKQIFELVRSFEDRTSTHVRSVLNRTTQMIGERDRKTIDIEVEVML